MVDYTKVANNKKASDNIYDWLEDNKLVLSEDDKKAVLRAAFLIKYSHRKDK